METLEFQHSQSFSLEIGRMDKPTLLKNKLSVGRFCSHSLVKNLTTASSLVIPTG